MKIIWNKVTWYSKLLAVIVLAFTIWLGFYFKSEFKKVEEIKPVLQVVATNTSDWKIYNDKIHSVTFNYPKDWTIEIGHRMSSQATVTNVVSQDKTKIISIGDYGSCGSETIVSVPVKCSVKFGATVITDNNDQETLSVFDRIFSSLQSNSEKTNDWKTYRNDKYGFEFKYPSSWISKVVNEDRVSLEDSLDASCHFDFGDNSGFGIENPDMSAKFKEVIIGKKNHKELRIFYKDNLKSILISGIPNTSKRISLYALKDNTLPMLCVNDFEKIVSTFKFTK